MTETEIDAERIDTSHWLEKKPDEIYPLARRGVRTINGERGGVEYRVEEPLDWLMDNGTIDGNQRSLLERVRTLHERAAGVDGGQAPGIDESIDSATVILRLYRALTARERFIVRRLATEPIARSDLPAMHLWRGNIQVAIDTAIGVLVEIYKAHDKPSGQVAS